MNNKVDTKLLASEILRTTNFNEFLEKNESYMNTDSFFDLLNTILAKKNYVIADIVNTVQLSKSYVYKIFSGEKKPTRDKLLQLTFAMSCSFEEAQLLLQKAGHAKLYPKFLRDSILIYAIFNKMTVYETNNLLVEHKESPIFNLL